MRKVRFLDCDCLVQRLEYANGGTCLQLVEAESGDDFLTATS